MASNVYLVKVLSIEERETRSDTEEISKYKRLEVVQEVGWWLNKFTFNMFPNHHPYNTVAVGDKLFLRVSGKTYLFFVSFDKYLHLFGKYIYPHFRPETSTLGINMQSTYSIQPLKNVTNATPTTRIPTMSAPPKKIQSEFVEIGLLKIFTENQTPTG